jgi:hypothetical protein
LKGTNSSSKKKPPGDSVAGPSGLKMVISTQNFFHNFASSCRSKNHIWEIADAEGNLSRGQQAIKLVVVRHFKPFFEAKLTENLQTTVTVARLFPHSVTVEDSHALDNPCLLPEILVALKSFSKDKSPGPDGWTVEFYLHFFDLVGPRSAGTCGGH